MIYFTKLHGAGNDFIIIDNRKDVIIDKLDIVVKACDRHFGVGADGCMFVELSNLSDIKMDFYNCDGSKATMCGNAIRCFSKFVYDASIVKEDSFSVETGDGIKHVSIIKSDKTEAIVSVDMGEWLFRSPTISHDSNETILKEMQINGEKIEISCVHMGVPHGVVFVSEIDEDKTIQYGPQIEHDSIFPQGINVNFAKVVNPSKMCVDTWERGAGKTLACGTGICSSVIIANRLGKVDKEVAVDAAGGQLKINLTNEHKVIMEGKAVTICEGKLNL